jgi:hypothetical protein
MSADCRYLVLQFEYEYFISRAPRAGNRATSRRQVAPPDHADSWNPQQRRPDRCTTRRAATGRLVFAISIHETADLAAAQRFWLETIGIEDAQFNRPVIKRHKPRTVRKNTGADYHGCLRIQVRRSIELYRQVEGWASAVMVIPASGSDSDTATTEAAKQPTKTARPLPSTGRGFEPS